MSSRNVATGCNVFFMLGCGDCGPSCGPGHQPCAAWPGAVNASQHSRQSVESEIERGTGWMLGVSGSGDTRGGGWGGGRGRSNEPMGRTNGLVEMASISAEFT